MTIQKLSGPVASPARRGIPLSNRFGLTILPPVVFDHHREICDGIKKLTGSTEVVVNFDADGDYFEPKYSDDGPRTPKDGNWVWWTIRYHEAKQILWVRPAWQMKRGWFDLPRLLTTRYHAFTLQNHEVVERGRRAFPLIESPSVIVSVDFDYFSSAVSPVFRGTEETVARDVDELATLLGGLLKPPCTVLPLFFRSPGWSHEGLTIAIEEQLLGVFQ